MKRIAACLIAGFGLTTLAVAAPSATAVATLAATVSRSVIAPRVAELNHAFGAQAAEWDKSCQDPESLRASYQKAADAWAQVEFFRAGPLSKQTLAERIDYWPDPRNATAKGLKVLLDAPQAPSAKTIAEASVAAQGLPALERLLYADGEAPKVIGEKECAVGHAIAHNLASLAMTLDAEWSDAATGELHRLDELSGNDAKASEAAVAILTDLATGLRLIEERKIPPLFAPNAKAAKSWRSGRSIRDIEQNMDALDKAYTQVAAYAPQAATSVKEKLHEAAVALRASEDANRAIAIQAGINNARYYASEVLPAELGVTLGFNSLDGD